MIAQLRALDALQRPKVVRSFPSFKALGSTLRLDGRLIGYPPRFSAFARILMQLHAAPMMKEVQGV